MPTFAALPGFRDFYPAEFALRAHIVGAWRDTARRYGYEEYDGPPLEPLELYIEKSGEEIVRQLYNFEDKGGRAVALRPEMTPSFARMGARGRVECANRSAGSRFRSCSVTSGPSAADCVNTSSGMWTSLAKRILAQTRKFSQSHWILDRQLGDR